MASATILFFTNIINNINELTLSVIEHPLDCVNPRLMHAFANLCRVATCLRYGGSIDALRGCQRTAQVVGTGIIDGFKAGATTRVAFARL
jgi:hypothetical protein